MKPSWRFLNTGYADGPGNMAVDEALLRFLRASDGCSVLRLYGWKPAAISVGYHQDVRRDIDVARCRREHVQIVRRLTGGRAVYHDEEVTYSVIASETDPVIGRSISDTYERIGMGLVSALRRLDIRAELQKASAGMGKNPSCFSSTGRHEVVCQGKKLIGSAQRRMEGMILQHGSLLIGPGYKRLTDLLMPGRSASLPLSDQNVVTLSEILGTVPSYQLVCEALRLGFAEAFGVELGEGTLSDEELSLAERLRIERYETEQWNINHPSPVSSDPLQVKS